MSTFTTTEICPATLIPAGDLVNLPEGTIVTVTQSLGSSITVKCDLGLFRIEPSNISKLGEEAVAAYAQSSETTLDTSEFSENLLWDALKQCFDPEIPVNIVDLGLIYDLRIEPAGDQYEVFAKMTLTAQGCGMGPTIAADAKAKLEAIPQVSQAQVDIVWDPVWNPNMISPAGKETLGL